MNINLNLLKSVFTYRYGVDTIQKIFISDKFISTCSYCLLLSKSVEL